MWLYWGVIVVKVKGGFEDIGYLEFLDILTYVEVFVNVEVGEILFNYFISRY